MWKLTIEDDEQKQTSLPLVHEEYGVGRAEGNVIRLTDRNVSRKHAILRRGGPGWIVKDLESYNGTYVNGLRVAGEAKVVHGDVVQLGDYRLEFNDEAKSVEAETARMAVDSNARPPHQRPDRLVVVVGPTPGQEFPLVGDHFTMGRAEDASISINHSSVSRFHAEIFALGTGRYEIIDKGSANGIRVNGHDLKRGIFEAGDAIELGDVRLRFVGAGKIFRAGGFDHRQQIAAVKGFDPVPQGSIRPAGAKAQSSGLGKWIAIGVGLGLLGVVGALIVLRTGVAETAPATQPSDKPATDDPGAAILREAIALSDKKEHDAAHKKVLAIPESSAARNDPKLAEVEARWADWMFEKVEKSSDPVEKRTILHEIATTQTVDAARRKKAANMIQEMDPTAPSPSASTSAAAPGTGGVSPDAPPGGEPTPGGSTPTPGGNATPGPGPGKPPEPAPSTSVDPRDQALKAPEATMNALIKKMSAGTASEQELRLLRGLCAQLGNRACWSAASAALKNLENK